MNKGEMAYIVDQCGSTFAFEQFPYALAFLITEEMGGSQNLTYFKVRVPRDGMTLEEIAEYACTNGMTYEDEELVPES